MKEIVFAGGCFWGIQEFFSRIKGVVDTTVGYANGHVDHPSYERVLTGVTGHAEACLVSYDEQVVSLQTLLDRFWSVIDPTVVNRQGPDIGHQYRTGIYYLDPQDLPLLEQSRDQIQQQYARPLATEILPLSCFYDAEEYHQDYLKKNPGGYCHIPLG